MISRTPACLSGVLGGLCWIARYLADRSDVVDAGGQLGTGLRWAGLTWVALALIGGGAGLARRSVLWLRLVISVSVLLLGAITLSLLYPVTGQLFGDALFGAVTVLGSLAVWWRGGRRDRAAHPHAHAGK